MITPATLTKYKIMCVCDVFTDQCAGSFMLLSSGMRYFTCIITSQLLSKGVSTVQYLQTSHLLEKHDRSN